MKREKYQAPAMQVVEIQQCSMLADSDNRERVNAQSKKNDYDAIQW